MCRQSSLKVKVVQYWFIQPKMQMPSNRVRYVQWPLTICETINTTSSNINRYKLTDSKFKRQGHQVNLRQYYNIHPGPVGK